VDDVMTTAVVSVPRDAAYRTVVDLVVRHRFSAVPVVDDERHVEGVVSEADLLRKIEYAGNDEPRWFDGHRRPGDRGKSRAGTTADLMSSPAVVVRRGTPIAAAARLMDAEQVKRLPVVDDAGRLVGIVSRRDLLRVHLRPDDDIRADIATDVLPALSADAAAAVTIEVAAGVVTMTGHVDRWSTADWARRLARQIPGVVEVTGECQYDRDDRVPMSGDDGRPTAGTARIRDNIAASTT
jgi:CBS-domain-containing membrane protein